MSDYIELTRPIYVGRGCVAELVNREETFLPVYFAKEFGDIGYPLKDFVEIRTVKEPETFIERILAGQKVHVVGHNVYWCLDDKGFIACVDKNTGHGVQASYPSMLCLDYIEYKPVEYFDGYEAVRRAMSGKKVGCDDWPTMQKTWFVTRSLDGNNHFMKFSNSTDEAYTLFCFSFSPEDFESNRWYEVE